VGGGGTPVFVGEDHLLACPSGARVRAWPTGSGSRAARVRRGVVDPHPGGSKACVNGVTAACGLDAPMHCRFPSRPRHRPIARRAPRAQRSEPLTRGRLSYPPPMAAPPGVVPGRPPRASLQRASGGHNAGSLDRSDSARTRTARHRRRDNRRAPRRRLRPRSPMQHPASRSVRCVSNAAGRLSAAVRRGSLPLPQTKAQNESVRWQRR
jgi:hypothetical protein